MHLKRIPALLIISFLLTGCQTTVNTEEVEKSLENIAVAMPPRDPFSNFQNVPMKLSDVAQNQSCGDVSAENIEEFVEHRKHLFGFLKKNKDIYRGRVYAEKVYQDGLPQHAAAFLEAIKGWDNPNWPSAKMGTYSFLATFYSAYGDYKTASSRLSSAQSYFRRHSNETCRGRNDYWMARAKAQINYAQGDFIGVLSAVKRAQSGLRINRYATDNECEKRWENWRTTELEMLNAKAYFGMGKLTRAESSATEVFHNGLSKTSFNRRQALLLLSKVKNRQSRFQEALSFSLIAKARQSAACISKSSVERAETNKELALNMLALGQMDDARTVMEETKENLKTVPTVWNNLFVHSVDRGLILQETGDQEQAREIYLKARNELSSRYGPKSFHVAEVDLLITLLDNTTDISRLDQDVRNTLQLWLSSTSDQGQQEGATTARLQWMIEDYISRVFDNNPSQQELQRAFEIAETLRSGLVKKALIQTALRQISPSPEIRQMVRRSQDLKRKKNVLLEKLSAIYQVSGRVDQTIEDLKEKIIAAEQAVNQMEEKLRQLIPEYNAITRQGIFTTEILLNAMQPGEMVVSTMVGRKQTFVWLVSADGKIVGHSLSKKVGQWRDEINLVRDSIEPTDGNLSNLLEFDLVNAHKIYKDLLGPYETVIAEANHLIFVSDNVLANLPMSMILTNPVKDIPPSDLMFGGFKELPWLIKKHAVSNVPSATALALLRKGGTRQENRLAFLGMGDPIFDPSDNQGPLLAEANTRGRLLLRAVGTTRNMAQAKLADLPRLYDTAVEIEEIARTIGADFGRDIFLGARASEATLRELNQSKALRQYKVLSFATHGLLPGDLDGLQSPALALSAPLTTPKGKWDDGLLTAEEIMEFDLDADWVVLSACNTGAAQASSNEAYSGLGQAFFYAGAKSLLLSNWPVLSDSTRKLMVAIFNQSNKNISRAESLRTASLEIMNNGLYEQDGLKFSYAHPLFWAPFVLVGDGGASKNIDLAIN